MKRISMTVIFLALAAQASVALAGRSNDLRDASYFTSSGVPDPQCFGYKCAPHRMGVSIDVAAPLAVDTNQGTSDDWSGLNNMKRQEIRASE